MCKALTCVDQGIECGPAGDGCGNGINCGTCPMGETCGGAGVPGKCGAVDMAYVCAPRTCAQQSIKCGPAGDGCGAQIDCGPCPPGETCGGGGRPGECGGPMCQKRTCQDVNANCGFIGDGCGGIVDCGPCPPGQTCGAGGVPNVCGGVG